MADISGLLGQIDTALGNPPANGAPQVDSAGNPIGSGDIVVHASRAPKLVPTIAPNNAAPIDPNGPMPDYQAPAAGGGPAPTYQGPSGGIDPAALSTLGAAMGGQSTPASPPQKSVARQTVDQINVALANRSSPASSAPNTAPSPASQKPTLTRVAGQIGAGFNEALADTAGAPVDLVNAGMGALGLPVSQTPFGGSQSIKKALGVIGANPDALPANSGVERVARGIGGGGAAMLLPIGALGAATEAGMVAPKVAATLGDVIGAPTTGGQAAGLTGIGATAGGAGQGASEAVPEPYKPYADIAGNLVGGGLAAGVGEGAALLGGAGKATKDFLAPLTAAGRQRIADQRLAKGATSPVAALDAIENNPRRLVEGSEPTTYQLTGDRGLGQMERQAAKKSPAPFLERAAQQNESRVAAVQRAAPNGDPAAVSAAFRSHLAELDRDAADAEARARAAAAEGETAARESAAQTNSALTRAAQAKTAELGGHGTPEGYGSELRARLADAKTAAKKRESALWNAVDPDKKLALDATPIGAGARKIIGEISPMAAPMNADEAGAFKAALTMRGGRRFEDVKELRTRVNGAMKAELKANGETPSYRRLAMLRGAVEDAISGAVEKKAAQEQAEVAAGTRASENTVGAALERASQEFLANRYPARARIAAGDGNATGVRSASVSSGARGPSEARDEPPNPPGDQSLSGSDELAPNFDEAARQRLNTATEATRQRAATFGSDPIGSILRSAGTQRAYRLADSALGEKLFPSGPGGFEAVQRFMAAAGDHPASQAQIRDLAAASLRRFAAREDGTLDAGRTAAWIKGHREALRAVPGLADRFFDAARGSVAIDDASAAGKAAIKDAISRGTQAIEDAATARKQSIDAYQKGLVGKLIQSDNPIDTTRMIGSIFGRQDAVALMRRLSMETRGNPEAAEGLKKAVVDHIANNFLADKTEDGQTVKVMRGEPFKRFVSKNMGPLSQVFKPQEMAGIRAVADDLARSDQSLHTKLPGQSNTAQDQAAEEKEHGSFSALTEAMVGASEGHHAFGLVGAVGGAGAAIGKMLLNVARQAGLRTVDDVVREMLLHPDLARAGLKRAATAQEAKDNALTFAQQMRRVSVFSPSLADVLGQPFEEKRK